MLCTLENCRREKSAIWSYDESYPEHMKVTPVDGIHELFQGVQFSNFPRGFSRVSRGFSPQKLTSIVVFQPLLHKISLSRGIYHLLPNFQGIIWFLKFPGGLVRKVRQYPCIIFFWNSPIMSHRISLDLI